MKYLKELNNKQKEAVLHTEGPLLILAGAGAGKTKTLTHRILHLIHQGVLPHKIMAITFTNKAAKEMRDRVNNLIASDETLNLPIENRERPFVSTFHSLGVHILKEQAHKLGLTRNFSIYDRADSKSAIKKSLKKLDFDPKEFEPGKILSTISREKGNMLTQKAYEEEVGDDFFKRIVSDVWREYEIILNKEKALDFDDLLLKPALLLKKDKQTLEYYQNKWDYVHIDEYQDTNEVQYQMAKMISAKKNNICVVGDVDQNIYTWRGATIKNIMGFEKDYPSAIEIVLEQNYRSTQVILSVANDIIKKNVVRREKNLFTKNDEGDKVTVYTAYDENDEARFVSEKIESLVREGVSPSEIAVLYRANFQSRVMEESFLHKGLKYQVLGTRFFDRKEIKNVLSFIKAALNPEDLTSLGRIINVPARGIGKVTFLKVAEGKENELTGRAYEKVKNFRDFLRNINTKIQVTKESPSDVIKYVLKNSGLEESFINGGEDGQERLENVKELATLAKKYEIFESPVGMEKLLEDAALASDQDELQKDNGGTKLMTIHASKGLEFDHVFITGLEDGLFPHERFGEKKEDEEEERRLFYVALTRARQKLFLTHANMRTIFGSQQVNTPSEFINDIEDHHLDYEECDDGVQSEVKSIFIDF